MRASAVMLITCCAGFPALASSRQLLTPMAQIQGPLVYTEMFLPKCLYGYRFTARHRIVNDRFPRTTIRGVFGWVRLDDLSVADQKGSR